MSCSVFFFALMAFIHMVAAQGSLSSTSKTTCLTKLGTTSVASIPTAVNLRSLTVNTIEKSTYTPTATSTPPDTTLTLSYTEFPTATTTVSNTEVDTFSTTTTIIDQEATTATVVVTTTTTNTQYTTVFPTTTVPTPYFFSPAQSAQAGKLYGRRRLAARQDASSTAASNPAINYVYTEAVSCTGVVEFFSVKTSVVATASAITTTLPMITDTTSTTETTTVTSSVLQTPASTTETISSTITTTTLAGTSTSTVRATASTTVTVQGASTTVYAACQPNNFISNTKIGQPIHAIVGPSPFGGTAAGPEAVLAGGTAYDCCVACFTTYGSNCGAVAFNTGTKQCLVYDGTKATSGNPAGGCSLGSVANILGYYGSAYKAATGLYTLSDGPCGSVKVLDPGSS